MLYSGDIINSDSLHVFINKSNTPSPTASLVGTMLPCMIDEFEGRYLATVDTPNSPRVKKTCMLCSMGGCDLLTKYHQRLIKNAFTKEEDRPTYNGDSM